MRNKALASKAAVVDLFCGAGGLTHGFVLEGLSVAAGVDVDPACRFPYEHNNGTAFYERDIRKLTGGELQSYFPIGSIRILSGCAPCQPFSTYSQSSARRSSQRWRLLNRFAQLVEEIEPQIVTMENVPQVSGHEVFKRFVNRLKALGYFVTINERVNCAHYGVPQTRRRLVLLASTYGPIDLISPVEDRPPLSVRHAIAGLQLLSAGQASLQDPLHKSQALSPLNLKRIRASEPGGTWRDWEPSLRAACHSRTTGKTYSSVYGRMHWDKLAPTITAQCFGFGNGRFGHPEQDRGISLREAALLQTFPIDYAFVPHDQPVHLTTIGRLIGNAVPVSLARAIAKSITAHLEEQQHV